MKVIEFSKRQFPLAHISGIPVRIDYRWFAVLFLLSALIAVNLYGLIESFAARFIYGLISALIFFASILFHELAHAFVARRESVEVVEIVLHPFGGLARMRHEPDTPRAEFRIAIAGPIASFIVALVFLLLTGAARALELDILLPLFFLLFFGNLLLAVFNLFPGYPLDGGRILRAFLWRRGTELNEATVTTGRAGQIISVALIGIGVFFVILRGEFMTGIWTALVGVFLLDAATGIIKQVGAQENLIVEDIMTLPVAVSPETNVSHFIDHILPLHRQSIFLVARDRQLYGVLLLEDLKDVPRGDWREKRILEVMRPVTTDYFVESNVPVKIARELMRENGIGALGVIDEQGNLVGFLPRAKTGKRK